MTTVTPTANSIESALIDLTGLSNLTTGALETAFNVDADFRKQHYGSADLHYINGEDANGILHGVLKIDADLHRLLDQFCEYMEAEAKQQRKVEVSITAAEPERVPIDNMRTDWGDAVAQMVQSLNYRQQDVIYKLVDMMEDIAVNAMPGPKHPHTAARAAINEICEAFRYIRECIGMAAEDAEVPADETAQQDRAALLLRYWAGDPGTNANDIAEVIAPFVEPPASITAKAA